MFFNNSLLLTGFISILSGIAPLIRSFNISSLYPEHNIAGMAGIAFILMVILGLNNGLLPEDIFLAGIVLAISAIPTGLPAIVTTMYSMGTRALAAQGAIVKRLPSVETLGSVSAICSDKTGTLTLNKMTAREFVVPGQNRSTQRT